MRGLTRRLRRGRWVCRPEEGSTFFRRERKYQRKHGGTATPEAARPAARYSQISAFRALPCPALVFAQACQSLTAFGSCAHWAHAPSRPKLRSAGALRAGRSEHGVSRCRIAPCRSALLSLPPSLRVALGYAQGPAVASLPFGTVRCAHPPGKRLLLPILTAGLAMSRAMKLTGFHIRAERARARLFPPSK